MEGRDENERSVRVRGAGEDEEVWEMKRKGWRTGGRRGEAR